MTGAEKVLKWMNEFYAVNGTPNFGEITAQLQMAIEEEQQQLKILTKPAVTNHVCRTCKGTRLVYIDEKIGNTLCPDC